MCVKFDVTKEERILIEEIVNRALAADKTLDRLAVTMDITACHRNGSPLRLADFLKSDDFNFAHDLYGIRAHLNRRTGKMDDFFLPRFAEKKGGD